MKTIVHPGSLAALLLLLIGAASRPLLAVPTAVTSLDASAKANPGDNGWGSNLDGALSRAGNEFKPVLVLFTSPGCGWCKRLKQEVFPDPDVAELLRHFVRVEIDVVENETAARQFQVRGVPALRILNAAGQMQSAVDGFVPAPGFQDFLRGALNPEFLGRAPESLTALLKLLDEHKLTNAQWPDLLQALGNKTTRRLVHDRVLKLDPPPARELVAMFSDIRLVVRLAALELAEEIAGNDFGFDPWAGVEANAEALAKWKQWAAAPDQTNGARDGILTGDQIRLYLRDAASDDRERSTRALRMLQNGGNDTLAALDDYLKNNPQLTVAGRNRIREVRYALVLPAVGKQDPLALAHQLVFGNLDTRIQALNALNGGGDPVLPVAREFLDDSEAMVREASVDTLMNVGGRDAVPVLEEHLRREKDANVVFAILRGLKRVPCGKADDILLAHLNDANEDLAVASIESLSKSKHAGLDKELQTSLSDGHWRVRVAALETAGELKLEALGGRCEKALEDADSFVRAAAVQTLPKLSGNSAAKKLEEIFLRDDDLKPAAVKGMMSLNLPLPDSFSGALKKAKPETIIGVIEAIGDSDDQGVELAGQFVDNPDPDVACGAIRLLAGKRLESARACGIIAQVLKGGDREKILTALQAAKIKSQHVRQLREYFAKQERPASASPGLVETLLNAFKSGGRKTGTGSIQEVAIAVENLFKTTNDPEIRSASAFFLVKASHPEALKYFTAAFPSLTSRDRQTLAESFDEGASLGADGLLRLLLRDPSQEVRSHAAEACRERSSNAALFGLLFEELLSEGHTLKPADILGYNLFSDMEQEPFRASGSPWIRKLIADADPKISTLGLLMIQKDWHKGDAEVVRPFFESRDPWQRRAAFQAFAWGEPAAFKLEFKRVAQDSSEYVRKIIPEVFKDGDQERLLALDEEKSDSQRSYNRGVRTNKLPEPEVLETLQNLTADPSNQVRLEAFFSLLSYQQPIDLGSFVATLNSLPDRKANSYRIASFLEKDYQRLGPEFAALLPFLDESRTENNELQKAEQHFAESRKPGVDKFAFDVRRNTRVPILATYVGKDKAPREAPVTARIKAVFFYTPGCPDCEKVEEMLDELKTHFLRLEIERLNLLTVEAMRLNEALCQRFNVPARLRAVGPAFFAGGGCLVRTELTYEALKNAIAQSAGTPNDWRTLPEAELKQAGAAIRQRYSTFGVSVVLLAGLLDGINPCAFATIIFLISYLQVARRSPSQILQVGTAFVAGVFLAYFILGLGLVEVVARISLLRGAGRLLNGALGILALVIMVASIRDGFLCLRGRFEETALQLPGFLKNRIHGVIRTGARHSRFMVAAFLSGAVISCLELACTGQVYAPTILYMLKSGRAAAVVYLIIYNLAFVIPLIGVFLLAYAGTRAPALIQFQNRHAALIKFATAALFFVLFIVLLLGF